VVLAAGVSLALPWLSGLEVDEAAAIWRTAPLASYSALEEAADLDPLGDEPDLLAGSIALRYGDLDRAERYFLSASRRVPGGVYARLELGAIASTRGQRRRALAYLGTAERLDPRSGLIASAAREVRGGGVLRVDELARALLEEAQQLR
jgi:tetratricopeptide (TPR) repeat protein